MRMQNPPHPGEIIRGLYLEPLELTVTQAAQALGVTRKAFSELLNGHSGISAQMALRLGKAFGNDPDLWLRHQRHYDLWEAEQSFDVSNVQSLYDQSKEGRL